MRDDFAVFILSYKRADVCITHKTLERAGYTGKYYIVIADDEPEDSRQAYFDTFGDKVIVFNKDFYIQGTDTGDCSRRRNAVVFARNACHDLAIRLGLTHFLVLDDDYKSFGFKYKDGKKLKEIEVKDFDKLCTSFIDFLDVSGALTVTFAQGGDFIGGAQNKNLEKGVSRKAMNSFFCRTDRPFKFLGTSNEDTTTYVTLGQVGQLFFTVFGVSLTQVQTQANKGGMTEQYLDNGTYVKSFYSVMFSPSCVKVAEMGDKHMRLHHQVKWDYCTPKIINERWRKRGREEARA